MDSPEREARDGQFESEVFPAELEEIARRRITAGLDPIPERPSRPSSDLGLTGLAVSGGGIRSATFSLGVVQVLARRGYLKRVDYLSTVSGGGYLGSCLSSLLNDPAVSTDEGFPLGDPPGESEPPALMHLRNGSNYLAPGGMLDKLRLPMLLLRGIVLNLLAFLPFVMLAVLVTEVAYEWGPDWDYLNRAIPILFAIFLLLVVLYPFVARMPRVRSRTRGRYEIALAVFFVLPLVVLLLVPIKSVTELAIQTGWATTWATIRGLSSPLGLHHYLTWAMVLGVVAGLAFAGTASRRIAQWSGKLVVALLGLAGPGILLALYWILCVLQIDSPYLPLEVRDELNVRSALQQVNIRFLDSPVVWKPDPDSARWVISGRLMGGRGGADPVWIAGAPPDSGEPARLVRGEPAAGSDEPAPAQPAAAQEHTFPLARLTPARPDSLYGTSSLKREFLLPGGLRSDLDRYAADPDRRPLADLLTEREISLPERVSILRLPLPPRPLPDSLSGARDSVFWSIAGEIEVGGNRQTSLTLTRAGGLYLRNARLDLFDGPRDWLFFGALAGLLLLNGLFFDVNLTSWHTFYRDTLSRVYLIRMDKEGEKVVENDRQSLAGLNADGSVAPYHLLNVVLNLEGSTDPSLRGRKGDFFFFGKRFTGGERTGYCETERLEELDRRLDLGTAMAISAAAAAPNMGRTTVKPLVFLLTLLNVRLGYWLLNPSVAREATKGLAWWRRRLLGPGPRYLWKEALGRLDENGTYVNLSDGGHIENLAIYPLLKRRCRVIVAVDGEADPRMRFGGLVTLIRFARIDMGIEIDLDLEALRMDEDGVSHRHWAIGSIDYGDGDPGILVYVKSSVTGDENEYIRSYRAHSPRFPHESTADQFFSENQFEAYRALGAHAAERMLVDPKLPEPLHAS